MQGSDALRCFPQMPGRDANDTMIPLVQFVSKSWDFMPTDVVRPMASTTVSDLAIMARRLGMTWKSFDPGSGTLRAEGNGHVFTSSMVRSLGMVVQYIYTSRKNDGNCAYIPVRQADKLGFGLVELDDRLFGVRGDQSYGLRSIAITDLDVGSFEGIARTLPKLVTKSSTYMQFHTKRFAYSSTLSILQKDLATARKMELSYMPGWSDLIPLCSAMLYNSYPISGAIPWQRTIPAPIHQGKGITASQEGFCIFQKRLKNLLSSAPPGPNAQLAKIAASFDELQDMTQGRWASEELWDSWDQEGQHSTNQEYRANSRAYVDIVVK